MATVERPPIEHVIEDMGDDALAETIIDIGEKAKELGRMAALAEHELILRMMARDATALDTDNWKGSLTPGAPSHEIDGPKMDAGLSGVLNFEEYSKVRVQPPVPEPRWDKRYLNELAKRGGRIREVIEGATTTTRGPSKLKLTRKS